MYALELIKKRKNPVIFDKQDRFLFFPNNKVCQTSITRVALRRRVVVKKVNETMWQKKLSQLEIKDMQRLYSFSIVRNPFDRAVSAFVYLQKLGEIDKKLTFAGFCREILQHQGTDFDPHFDPQTDALFFSGKPLVDKIARFETINEDWKGIAAEIGSNAKFPHENKSRRKHYAEYYDDSSREIIRQLYREDFIHLDYSW